MARTDQPHKLTFDAFVAKSTDFSLPVNAKHRGVDYSRPETRAAWNGSKVKVPLWCKVHKEFFVQQPANHMNGQGCPKCGKEVYKAKRRLDDPTADFRKVHGDTYDYSRVVYENVQTKVEIICATHGPFWQKPNAHLTGQGCPDCWEFRRKRYGEARNEEFKATFAERSAEVHKGACAIVKLPEHAHDLVVLHCPTHGEFTQKAYSHLDGHGCWQCGQNTNFAELELAAFIEGLGVKIENENRTVLGGLHIDIWVPEKNLGIEYHGSFWHTEERIGRKHREKYERAVAAGIRLIQVFDFEWLERRSAVENRLRALIATDQAVGARQCSLREVQPAEARRFFDEVHTQGSGPHPKVAYGLEHNGRLVACMSFGDDRYGKAQWEMLRYASRGRVQGGFSRLLAAFKAAHNPMSLLSYCDLRWGDGAVYRAAGFDLDGVTAPDYWYVDRRGANRKTRYAVRKLLNGRPERQWAEETGHQKVLGVGHQRWIWRSEVHDLV